MSDGRAEPRDVDPTPVEVELRAEVVDALETVPAAQWNRIAGTANPFVRHEFLVALERHGCVGEEAGWLPQHLVVWAGERLVGAVPMYAKNHSYGEFVFDWGWAEAYERSRVPYYPKLVVAIPFTPAGGPRLLYDRAAPQGAAIADALVGLAVRVAEQARVSSLHWLFLRDDDAASLRDEGLLERVGCQFHWQRGDWRDFDDYLDALTSKRRKEIRRERRDAAAAPVEVEVLRGHEVSEAQWHAYHALYASTYDRKWGYPSLTPEFFQEIGRTMGESVVLVLARRGHRHVAGAHLLRGEDTLFGRNWGCTEFHPGLHFEMCYYRPIEVCLEDRLEVFEAGAQGEHKLTRGFLPVLTRSAHWIRHDGFRDAIARFVAHERADIERYVATMHEHSPFRAVPPASDA